MYDIHTHILYGIDDGATDLEQMLQMARDAAEDNITHLIATPHHADEHYWNPGATVRERVDAANAALQHAQIPVTIYPGQEVRLYDGLLRDLQDSYVITLNDSRYLLLELPASHVPRQAVEMVHELRLLGITAIIAHPERNAGIVSDTGALVELLDAGALAQVTSHSLTGKFGRKTRQLAIELCKRYMVHLIASDAHNTRSRNCKLKAASDIVSSVLGRDYHDYYITNARAVLDDQPIDVMPVDRPVKKKFLFF